MHDVSENESGGQVSNVRGTERRRRAQKTPRCLVPRTQRVAATQAVLCVTVAAGRAAWCRLWATQGLVAESRSRDEWDECRDDAEEGGGGGRAHGGRGL